MYSKEFRRQLLTACDAGGGTREVAMQFSFLNRRSGGSSRCVVSRARRLRRPLVTAFQRGRNGVTGCGKALLKSIADQPDIYLHELQVKLESEQEATLSPQTLSEAYRAVRLTRQARH